MKNLNKRELQQIAFDNSSGIDLKDFMSLYKNVLQNYGVCLVIDTGLESDNY